MAVIGLTMATNGMPEFNTKMSRDKQDFIP
jgi:hypothetical protein